MWCPVLASRSGEIPHVVSDAGLLVDEGGDEANVARWTEAIERLLEDADLRRDLSARGLARAHEKYAWPVVARAHLAFFEELL